uniref:non-specific serine/threonine protein kinase n=1 Tax=Plectus sambesii TaxID=2011161 RepID=A0A914WAL0_9BILA
MSARSPVPYDRVLFISNRARNAQEVKRAVSPGVSVIYYPYESTSLDALEARLQSRDSKNSPISHLGFVLHIDGGKINITGVDKTILSKTTTKAQSKVKKFFESILNNSSLLTDSDVTIDFFGCDKVADLDIISKNIRALSKNNLSVTFSCDFVGVKLGTELMPNGKSRHRTTGEYYFNTDKLGEINLMQTRIQPTTAGYEKIRVVGKGAFGAAILYRRKDDDSLVILKEINMHDLSGLERQLALNEVSVLSQLDHPHIVSYYDSFEEDGVLMIEMEYAEGGTLAQFLSKRESRLEEREILHMFQQMISAVCYLHHNSVLHRDLKTANIFLSKEGDIKIGDFGISKIMGTETKQQGANTVLGTPYYISPEMCEGKTYNEKSDIWALGCILYEMACLQKTFEGSNLPALVNKIMKGQYDQVRGNYSAEFKILIRDILRKEPELRPSARQILHERLPDMMARFDGKRPSRVIGGADDDASSDSAAPGSVKRPKMRSVLYGFDHTKTSLYPLGGLPSNIKVRQIAMSKSHHVMVTSEKLVYVWGANGNGQLGLGDRNPRPNPSLAQTLTGKSIARVGVGDQFSVFCSENGIAMSCGHRRYTGNGSLDDDILRPKLIDSLLSVDILSLSCGPRHAVVIAEGGKVFVWGDGAQGRLGNRSEQDVLVATQIAIPNEQMIRTSRCGVDATVLLTDSGSLLAMGSNHCNKLNLNQRQGFFSNAKGNVTEVTKVLSPTSLKNFPSRVVDVSMGSSHTAVLLESGHLHMFGRNAEGQLGRGHREPTGASGLVKPLSTRACVMVQCGDGFSIAGTSDNELYFWGSKRSAVTSTTGEDPCLRSPTNKPIAHVHPFAPNEDEQETSRQSPTATAADNVAGNAVEKSSTFLQNLHRRNRQKMTQNANVKSVKEDDENGIITLPNLVLRLDTSGSASGIRTLIRLSSVACCGSKVIVIVETSAPAPNQEPALAPRIKAHRQPTDAHEGQAEKDRKTAPLSRHSSAPAVLPIPDNTLVATWIRNELDQAEVLVAAPPASKQSLNKPPARHKAASVSSSDSPASAASKGKRKRKRRSSAHLAAKSSPDAIVDAPAKIREQQLIDEIDALKKQLADQHHSFQDHVVQIDLLQNKLADMQTNQKETNGAPSSAPASSTGQRKSAVCSLL